MEKKRITTQKEVDGSLAAKLHGLGGNLYLDVQSATSRQWLFIFKRSGRQRTKGLGSATGSGGPKITLAEARRRADRYRADLAGGRDPLEEERRQTTLLGAYAETYVDSISAGFRSRKTEENWRRSFRQHAAGLARKPVATLTSADVVTVLKPLWLDKPETARRLRHRLERVLRAAKADGLRVGENPATMENLGLPKHRKKGAVRHYPAMAYGDLPAFLASLSARSGTAGILPLRLLILTATRTAETANAEWREFDLTGKLWTIPARRVKNGADHHVPLTAEMLDLLASVPRGDGQPRLFPACGRNTMLKALKRIEGCEGCTVHGFRSAFRDWCGNETSFAREVVEETYGHDPSKDDVERAYRRQKALRKRRQVLEAWNGYVAGSKVVQLRKVA